MQQQRDLEECRRDTHKAFDAAKRSFSLPLHSVRQSSSDNAVAVSALQRGGARSLYGMLACSTCACNEEFSEVTCMR